jgi:integrase/recombinase XerD
MFVKGPRFSRQIGVTPILERADAGAARLDPGDARSEDSRRSTAGASRIVPDVKGLRDRAVIAIMAYTFARVSAVAGLELRRLPARRQTRPATHGGKGRQGKARMAASRGGGISGRVSGRGAFEAPETALFQTLDKTHRMSGDPLTRRDMLRIVKERCRAAGLSETFCNHTFRGTGSLCLPAKRRLALEAAQDMANHSDPAHHKAL